MGLSKYQQEGIKQFLSFVNTPLPEHEEDWCQFEERVSRLYKKIDPRVPPLPPQAKRRQWINLLWHQARALVQHCCDALTAQGKDQRWIALPHRSGTLYLEVTASRLVPTYRHYKDPTSAFLLMLVNLLTWLDDLSQIQRCACGNWFHKIKRQEYCSRECKEKAHPSRDRTKDYRVRRAVWDSARQDLEQALKRGGTLYKTTERQVLEWGESAIEKAEQDFQEAFPRKMGQGYEAGKAFLARVDEQVKRLRKKVKGY